MRSVSAKLDPMEEMSLEEWADLPEDEEGELVDGRLVEEEVPSLVHEEVVSWFIQRLRNWAEEKDGFVFGSEAKYAVGAKTGRKPDVAMYLPGRKLGNVNLVRTPPDVILEVISKRARDRRRDRIDKAREYAAFGVRVYVLLDPDARTFEVLELVRKRWVVAVNQSEGRVKLPLCEGLELDLDALWKRLDLFAH
jgi:Uma2 family endonuclease